MNVACYARTARLDPDGSGDRLQEQIAHIHNWCKVQGHTVAACYSDAGASGATDNRHGFRMMIEDALMSPPPFQAIVVRSPSCFFRNVEEYLKYSKLLAENGVTIQAAVTQTGISQNFDYIEFAKVADSYFKIMGE